MHRRGVESPARLDLEMMTGLRRWLRIPDHFQPGVGSPFDRLRTGLNIGEWLNQTTYVSE